ncbi:TetR/AcrR family transcriptional regulator [Mesorhizobium qingshengii]|uniref:Transcriptional regulator, TetR family n=1 Tax=Mesorhizobium qingshengii TaxID=1165689 RepID=A0A1G5ZPS6_9HYPH|nr:TetR/AcrR family transcriptional regulator [Mesorhizobium qingshengii]SDA96622.1 transcriptional regulator, TetR family [Mesorhizobium qingshengii]
MQAETKRTTPLKERMIAEGLRMLLEHGYNGLGVQAVLDATGSPKGSFYHHFRSKEDFALAVVDAYIANVHALLEECVNDHTRPPLDRIRLFFETVEQSYREEGYLGCLMGGLGQELSGVSDVFRRKIDWCFSSIAERLTVALEDARKSGTIRGDSDSRHLANLLVDCWEGAALRSRLKRSPASLQAMLEFFFSSVTSSGY